MSVNPEHPEPAVIREAASLLRSGGLVAFPTETVYGLGANGLSREAVAGIFRAKDRPADNPLILHVAETGGAAALASEWSDVAAAAAAAFWPGPLTLVVPAREIVPDIVTAGLPTVAVRVPDHPVALALLKEAKVPVAAPSANRSGRPSPTRAAHVWDDMKGRIELILDGGPVGIGLESTVLDVTAHPPVILRPGGVSVEALREQLGDVAVGTVEGTEAGDAPRSPGMKYRHYAPSCPVELVTGDAAARRRVLVAQARAHMASGLRVGVIATEETAALLIDGVGRSGGELLVRAAGPAHRADVYAARLFALLRELEAAGCDVILMEGIEPRGIGFAVMNRLRKAAGSRVIHA